MDMLKLFETRSGVPRMTVIHDYPKYTFRREGEFFYSLSIQSEDTDDRICEITVRLAVRDKSQETVTKRRRTRGSGYTGGTGFKAIY